MRFAHFLLVTLVITSNKFTFGATKSTTTENVVPPDPISTTEERLGLGRGSVPVGGYAVPSNGAVTTDKEMVTVSRYFNNGLLQLIGKWWTRTFNRSNTKTATRRLRRNK